MNVIRFELEDGLIVYTDAIAHDAIRQLLSLTGGAERGTLMTMEDGEYHRLPQMNRYAENPSLVSRWDPPEPIETLDVLEERTGITTTIVVGEPFVGLGGGADA